MTQFIFIKLMKVWLTSPMLKINNKIRKLKRESEEAEIEDALSYMNVMMILFENSTRYKL